MQECSCSWKVHIRWSCCWCRCHGNCFDFFGIEKLMWSHTWTWEMNRGEKPKGNEQEKERGKRVECGVVTTSGYLNAYKDFALSQKKLKIIKLFLARSSAAPRQVPEAKQLTTRTFVCLNVLRCGVWRDEDPLRLSRIWRIWANFRTLPHLHPLLPPSLSFFSLARFANMLLMNQFSWSILIFKGITRGNGNHFKFRCSKFVITRRTFVSPHSFLRQLSFASFHVVANEE